MILTATSQTIKVITSATATIDVVVQYADITSTTLTPGSQETAITTAATTTVLTAPAASTQRKVISMSLWNRATTTATCTVIKDNTGTDFYLHKAVLGPGNGMSYTHDGGWERITPDGSESVSFLENPRVVVSGAPTYFTKTSTAQEAAGATYMFSKDAGFPGAWTAPVAGTGGASWSSANPGGLPLPPLVSGNLYLSGYSGTSTIAGYQSLIDIVWANSGLSPTSTSAQSITAAASAARDLDGTTNGRGIQAYLYITTSNTSNASPVSVTITYTNAAGTTGQTATASVYALCLVGTLIPFNLAAGSEGVRSVQSYINAATLGAGTLHLILARPLASIPIMTANIGGGTNYWDLKPLRIFNDPHIAVTQLTTSASATTVTGFAAFSEF